MQRGGKMFFSQIGLDEKQSQQGFFGVAESEELSKSDVSKQSKGREEPLEGRLPVELQQTTGIEIVGTLYDKMFQSKEEKENLEKVLTKDFSQSADGQDHIGGAVNVSNMFQKRGIPVSK